MKLSIGTDKVPLANQVPVAKKPPIFNGSAISSARPRPAPTAIDRLLMATGSLVILISSFFLMNEDLLVRWIHAIDVTGEPVGKVLTQDQDVRRRYQSSLSWFGLASGEPLYENDTLFTGADSHLTVRVDDATEIELGPNSLVVLERSAEGVILDFRLGQLRARVPENSQLKLRQKQKLATIASPRVAKLDQTQAKPATLEVQIDKQAQDIEIHSISGEAEVQVDDQVTALTKAEAFIVSQNQEPVVVKELPLETPNAEALAEIPPVPTEEVTPAPAEEPLPVVDNAPAELMPPKLLNAQKTKLVLDFDIKKFLSKPRQPELALKNPPKLSWETPSAEGRKLRIVIEIAEDSDFSKPLVQQFIPLNESRFVWRAARPGQFFWRVKAEDIATSETVRSPTHELILATQPPRLAGKMPVRQKASRYVFAFPPQPYAENYQIQMAVVEAKKPRKLESQNWRYQSHFKLPQLSLTELRALRLRAAVLDSKGRMASPFSSPIRLDLPPERKLASPQLSFPEDQTNLVSMGTHSTERVAFAWQRVSEAQAYRLQIAYDRDFKSPVVDKISQTPEAVIDLKVIVDQVLYWRVRAEDKGVFSPWSKPRALYFY